MPLSPLPAHSTKHHSALSYPFNAHIFNLSQHDDGHSNGTALWLGAQCLSLYLLEVAPRITKAKSAINVTNREPRNARKFAGRSNRAENAVTGLRPKAIELGSGIGLTALALASMGWDVLATDTAHVIASVLGPNILHNINVSAHFGAVQVKELDWTVLPSDWIWNNSTYVAVHSPEIPDPLAPSCNENLRGIEERISDETLKPPFDLIVTSDTIYSPALITPLLRTIHHLCCCSLPTTNVHLASPVMPITRITSATDKQPQSTSASMPNSRSNRRTPVYIALENRDPELISSFLAQAQEEWGFIVERVPDRKVAKSMEKGGIVWDRGDWEGVEIWKMVLGKVIMAGDLNM